LLIDILRGSTRAEVVGPGYDRLKTWGAGADLPYPVWREYIYQMIQLGYLEIDYADGNALKVTESGRRVLFEGAVAPLNRYRDPEELREQMQREKEVRKEQRRTERAQLRAEKTSARRERSTENGADPADAGLLQSLKALRRELAAAENIPAYIVFSDAALVDMAARRPVTLDEFLEVKGVGEVKARKYGDRFVGRVREWGDGNFNL
jgi:ATP-dependent DNA helicase RecQ